MNIILHIKVESFLFKFASQGRELFT